MAKTKPSSDPGANARVEQLRTMCGLSAAKCRAALAANGNDVELALAALIDAGTVKTDDLHLDLVSDELFGRAGHREIGGVYHMPSKSSRPFANAAPDDIARITTDLKKKLEEQGKDFKDFGVRDKNHARIKRRLAALKNNPLAIKLPPFPKLNLTYDEWRGTDVSKTWPPLRRSDRPAGKFDVVIPRAENDDDDAKPAPPAPEMVAAYAHWKEHEEEVATAVLGAFLSALNPVLMKGRPRTKPVKDTKQLKNMMELDAVFPSTAAKDGMAYLGFFFQCTWDEEHGAGVLLHGRRVIRVGDHDAAGDTFAALSDGGKEIAAWDRGLAGAIKDGPKNPFLD